MKIGFGLCLPRDEVSVPVVRHLTRDALEDLGVEGSCIADVELGITEACTNVLQHAAGTGSDYEVQVEIDEGNCEIRVVDTGEGFDLNRVGDGRLDEERGRGIMLMQALVDELRFVSDPGRGTIVRFRKRLVIQPGGVLERLHGAAADGPGTT